MNTHTDAVSTATIVILPGYFAKFVVDGETVVRSYARTDGTWLAYRVASGSKSGVVLSDQESAVAWVTCASIIG